MALTWRCWEDFGGIGADGLVPVFNIAVLGLITRLGSRLDGITVRVFGLDLGIIFSFLE